MPRNFRILSLDGGGTWALIQVCALKTVFGSGQVKGHDVLKAFDLAIGNSGGSIVLGALLANMSLDDLLGFFSNTAKLDSIFVPASIAEDPVSYFLRHFLDQDIGPKYDAAAKLTGLSAALSPTGALPMTALSGIVGNNYRNVPVNFVICGFDYDSQRETFFRSDAASIAASGTPAVGATLAEAIHASSNAPVNYFDAPAQFLNRRYWDGAIGGYNNPVFAGVIEAIANAKRYGIVNNQIAALSLGTGSVALLPPDAPGNPPDAFVAARTTSTIPHDLVKMAESILDDPPDAASFHTHVMLGGGLENLPVTDGPIVRMSPLIQPIRKADGTWTYPSGLSPDQFGKLVNLDFDAHDIPDIALIQDLCNSWLADRSNNQPIRANAATTEAEIGHGKFSQALAAWKALWSA